MKRLLFTFALFASCNMSVACADTGLNLFSIDAPHHSGALEMAVMYPSESGTSRPFGENAVFYGVPVHDYSKIVPGKYPVIVMSHGWGGNFGRMGWLTSALAEKGAIVIAVNHPNSTTGDLNKDSALKHWTRAQDLTLALSHVLKDNYFAKNIDTSRVYATGFSYGGWTALSLAGLTGRADGYADYCEAAGDSSTHCRDLRKMGIDLSKLDDEKWHASYKDSRITSVAAIDPALTWGLSQVDTTGLSVPVLLIGLGEGEDRLSATDTSAKGSNFEALFPEAKIEVLSPASHYSALGICKPAGAAILVEEKDDPVCNDPAGSDRKKITARIIDLIARHFDLE